MAKKTSQPGSIHLRIVEVMKRFPEGISGGQIRHELEREGILPEDLGHLVRRIRELDKWFIIEKKTQSVESRGRVVDNEGQITETSWAEVLYGARGRCQMCGKTIEMHGIALVVRRNKLRGWVRTSDRENLWAICEECDNGTNGALHHSMIARARPGVKGCRMSVKRRRRQT